jgi:hypothetical protein
LTVNTKKQANAATIMTYFFVAPWMAALLLLLSSQFFCGGVHGGRLNTLYRNRISHLPRSNFMLLPVLVLSVYAIFKTAHAPSESQENGKFTFGVQTDGALLQETASSPHWVRSDACSANESHDCTPSGLRWQHEVFEDPCSVVKGKHIIFVGDSFVRHLFVATILRLTGDYQQGALVKKTTLVRNTPEAEQQCLYKGQFEEKMCRMRLVSTIMLCNRTTRLSLKYSASPSITQQDITSSDVLVWGIGNHPIDGADYVNRPGVNNASVTATQKLRPVCSKLKRNEAAKKVIWADTHVQLKSYLHPDQAWVQQRMSSLQDFHEKMPAYLYNVCGIERIVSLWDATYELAMNHTTDAQAMTYDGMHWTMEVNLLKADALLSEISQD